MMLLPSPPKQYLFLDIDGVLLPFGGGKEEKEEVKNEESKREIEGSRNKTLPSTNFPPSTLHAFNHIIKQVPNVQIVLSSTWRCGGGLQAVLNEFANCNLQPLSTTTIQHTTDVNQHDYRQWEIASWLLREQPKKSTTWVTLDDEELLEGEANKKYHDMFQGHCVKTVSSVGLTWCDAKKAISILNGAEIKPKLPIILKKLPKNTCRHWWKRGSCRMGNDCRFLHPARELLPAVPRRKYRQQVNNAGRFRQFREWVINTFPNMNTLNNNQNVLCVADGKGILSFELYNVHNIQTTVIDPRPLSLVRNFKLWYRGLYHKETYKNIIRYVPTKSMNDVPDMPNHIRAFFIPEFWESKNNNVFQQNLCKAENTLWGKQGLQPSHDDNELSNNKEQSSMKEKESVVTTDDTTTAAAITAAAATKTTTTTTTTTTIPPPLPTITNKEEDIIVPDTTVRDHQLAMNIITNCTLVLGMHPDQAAGPIVEFAIKFNKSFAVVPCCVYSNEFPKRKLKNGKQVSSYEDLLQYLIELAPKGDIQKCIIPNLKGKNICLYRIVQEK